MREGAPSPISAGDPLPVSVVVPVYNGEAFLAAALDSILTQQHRPSEVLVVDAGSTDASPAIVRAHPDVRLIAHPNDGPALGRNTGIAAARGPLIAFLDQDDVWAADKLAAQVAYMRERPRLGYTLGHLRFFLESGCPRPRWLRPELLDGPRPGYVLGTLLAWKWVFERVGLFDPRYRQADDADWFARAADAQIPMAVLDRVLLHKRVHAANLSADTRTGRPELLEAVRASIGRKRTATTTREP